MIFLALPFLFVAFIWQFPAGLLVYWITTNLWTILQQSIIKKRLGPLREQAMAAAKAAKEEQEEAKKQGKAAASPTGRAAAARSGSSRRPPRPPTAAGLEAAVVRRPAAGTAAQEEEALGAPPVTNGDATAAERVRELLEQVNEALDLDASVEIEQPEDGRDPRHARRRGPRPLHRPPRHHDRRRQHLAYRIAAAADDGPQRVIVDAAGYRERREQALHRQADEAAEDAVRSGRPVALDAMSATERKVVHEHLKDREDVETYSEGTEPDRHLVVAPLD